MKNVTRRTYCPFGVPALLNGDFYENVAHLWDFSWSVMLHDDPAEQNSMENIFVLMFAKPEKEPEGLSGSTWVAIFFLYAVILFLVLKKLIHCIPITRRILQLFTLFMFLFNIYYCTVLMFWTSLGFGIFMNVVLHFCIFCHVLHFAFNTSAHQLSLVASQAEYPKIRAKKYWIFFVISAILIFLFFPAERPPHICPHLLYRFYNEISCYFIIFHQFILYCCLLQTLNMWEAKEFVIKDGKDKVGKLVKKKNGKWVVMKLYANGYLETKELLSV